MKSATYDTKTLLDKLIRPASAGGSAPAIIETGANDRQVSFSDLEILIEQAQTLLSQAGIVRGDRVLLVSPNSPEVVSTVLAAWRLGALAIPVDFRMTAQELVNVAKRLSVKVVASSPALVSESMAGELAHIKVLYLDKIAGTKIEPVESPGFASLQDPAFLILTSGTTGEPKGALHDLHALMLNMQELADMAGLCDRQKVILPVPFSHVLGLEVTLAALLNQCTVIFCEMSIEGIIGANNKFKPEFLVGVPTIYGALLATPKDIVDLSGARVILCGGAPLPDSLATDFLARFQKRLNNGYGSTESKIIAVNIDGPFLSVGKVVPSCQIKVLGSEGESLSDGEVGEIVICGDMLMKGYIGQDEATKEVFDGKCYRTGDIGYMENGYLFISGRAKEMIIVAGNKVFPSEVEGVLRQCPLCKEVAVIGVAHSRLGQIVKAHIVISDKETELSKGLSGNPEEAKAAYSKLKEEFRSFCQINLKRELRPMEWVFHPADQPLPRTFSGKIDKKQLS